MRGLVFARSITDDFWKGERFLGTAVNSRFEMYAEGGTLLEGCECGREHCGARRLTSGISSTGLPHDGAQPTAGSIVRGPRGVWHMGSVPSEEAIWARSYMCRQCQAEVQYPVPFSLSPHSPGSRFSASQDMRLTHTLSLYFLLFLASLLDATSAHDTLSNVPEKRVHIPSFKKLLQGAAEITAGMDCVEKCVKTALEKANCPTM